MDTLGCTVEPRALRWPIQSGYNLKVHPPRRGLYYTPPLKGERPRSRVLVEPSVTPFEPNESHPYRPRHPLSVRALCLLLATSRALRSCCPSAVFRRLRPLVLTSAYVLSCCLGPFFNHLLSRLFPRRPCPFVFPLPTRLPPAVAP